MEPFAELTTDGLLDTDQGRNMSLAKCVTTSPRRYAIMHSPTGRFPPPKHDAAVSAVYDTDTAHRKSIQSSMRDTRRFYASSFNSTAPRLAPSLPSCSTDKIYDPERLKNADFNTVAAAVQHSTLTYGEVRSKHPRFAKQRRSEGADKEYDVNTLQKQTLATAVLTSPRNYHTAFSSKSLAEKGSSARLQQAQELGPGTYTAPYWKDVRSSQVLTQRPWSCFASTTRRSGIGPDSNHIPGS